MNRAPLEKVTLNIFTGDKDTLIDFFPASGWSVAARHIIHNHCKKLREKASKMKTENLTIELPER